jgi:hypothetical protein
MFISYKFNKIYENNIINIVLSKLEYIPKYYKIIRKKNRIIIKCHHYSNIVYTQIEHKNIQLYNYYKSLDNYDNNKTFSIVIYDIIIDLTNKNYKIITSYFTIINCINDLDNLYNKLIEKLNNKSYYIQINNLYDTDLNFNCQYDERTFELILKNQIKYNRISENNFKMYNSIKLNNESINIIIKNDKNDNMIINSMFIKLDNNDMVISNTIDTKPHIYNKNGDIRLNKITGYFI